MDIEKKLQEEEDEELIRAIQKQNEKICCCFSKKLKKSLKQQVKNQLIKSKDFESKIEERKIDISKITKDGDKSRIKNEWGKIYLPKEHHGKCRKRLITCQNKFWADIPMTIFNILCLFFIPAFQYCDEILYNNRSLQYNSPE